jgi:hypothetical protein
MSHFTLSEEVQSGSFPAVMAEQMGTIFPQPVFQAPGVGNTVGFAHLPVRVPATLQTTGRKQSPPSLFVFNLSVPEFRLSDTLSRRPQSPLIHENDSKQTVTNLILGFPTLILEGDFPLWTQLEYAQAMHPSFVLTELGFYDVLAPAVEGDLSLLPDPSDFTSNYSEVLASLVATNAKVMLMTVSDPIDTAYFSSIETAAKILKVPPFVVLGLYGLRPDELVTVRGLIEMGNQFIAREIQPLPSGSFLTAPMGEEISFNVEILNEQIRTLANQHGAIVFELHSFFKDIKNQGVMIGSRLITGDFLGGFYSLNGYYPGITGHALLANAILDQVNKIYGESFAPVDVAETLLEDATARTRLAEVPDRTLESMADFLTERQLQRVYRVARTIGEGTSR